MKKIELDKGKITLVSDKDFEKLKNFKWYFHESDGYVIKGIYNGNSVKTLQIHRFILGLGDGDNREVDHINGDKLDNRRENLRICTSQNNKMNRPKYSNNTSGFKGVYWRKDKNKWQAKIQFNSKQYSLGYFLNKISAAKSYNIAATKFFKEFACLNKI